MEWTRAFQFILGENGRYDGERASIIKEVMRYHPVSKRLKKLLAEKEQVAFFYLDIVQFADIERRFGERTAAELIELVETCIRIISHEMIDNDRLLEVENFWGDDFLVCYQLEAQMDEQQMYEFAAEFRNRIVQDVNQKRPQLLSAPLDLHLGYAVLSGSYEPLERQLYRTIKQAVKMARKTAKGGDQLLQEFQEVLNQRAIQSVYQPIISCETGEALGWEALSRGPEGSRFQRPDTLFTYAEEAGELYRLEKICRERAIEGASGLAQGAKLFLNINPRTIHDPQFTKGETKRLLDRCGLSPSQVVFEITERHSIQDYAGFRKTLEHYRQQGYLIAVDDAGAGYSSLQSIVELCPDFIKMDMSLVRGVHNDPVKQALLEAFVALARKIRCKIIAEGIEQEEEFKTLLRLGIDYGQGYLLGRPQRQMTLLIPISVMQSIDRRRTEKMQVPNNSMLQVGSIATSTFVVPPDATVKEVHELLENRRQISSVVVAGAGRPIGLLTRDHLYAMLGSQYGVPLYYKRTVAELMDPHPLTVEQNMLIDEVSSLATGRNNLKRYDDVIVTSQGEYRGVVSVQTLLDVMSKVKIEIAKYANPLTGLPGNLRIEEELRMFVRRGDAFSILYVDLDYFKRFNDLYGFEYGDQMILFVSTLLDRQVKKYGDRQDFLGHIGGDDFVIITSPERVDRLAERTIRLFDRAVRQIMGNLRERGECVQLSVTLAALDISANSNLEPSEIAAKAAHVKSLAKQQAGSSIVRKKSAQS